MLLTQVIFTYLLLRVQLYKWEHQGAEKVKAVALVTQSLDLNAGGLPSVPTSLSPLDWAGNTEVEQGQTSGWENLTTFPRAGPSLIHPALPLRILRPQRHWCLIDKLKKSLIGYDTANLSWVYWPQLKVKMQPLDRRTRSMASFKTWKSPFFCHVTWGRRLAGLTPKSIKIWERPFINFLGEHFGNLKLCADTKQWHKCVPRTGCAT